MITIFFKLILIKIKRLTLLVKERIKDVRNEFLQFLFFVACEMVVSHKKVYQRERVLHDLAVLEFELEYRFSTPNYSIYIIND